MKVLIVVDMQNDFICGSLGSAHAYAIVKNVRSKIKEYKSSNYEIFFTRDTHSQDYLETQEGKNLPIKHCIFGTDGWEIYDGLDNECKNCIYINKPSFGWNNWTSFLGDTVDEIELVGLCTDICVVSNALILKATYPEVNITVDASCCAGITEESHRAALLTMKMCQINIINEGL